MIVCTSICSNYLSKAMVLAKSLKKYNKETKFIVCLVEKDIPEEAKEFSYFDHIILAKDLSFENFNAHIFKHSIVEAATSVKGKLFQYLLKQFEEEKKFVYLDPDIKVYGKLDELEYVLENNEIVLTPHIFQPENAIEDVIHNELNSLRYGVFNLGFLAVSRGGESQRFIDWWAERLQMFCYNDIPNGIFTDQKWIDLAPCLFNVHILKHEGYNLAPWNYSTRVVSDKNGEYNVNNLPLKFLHFSGFDSGANELVTRKYIPDESNPIYLLRQEYISELKEMNEDWFSKINWSYNFFDCGEKIELQSRTIYRENKELQSYYNDPFNKSNSDFLGVLNEISDEEWENISKYLVDKSDINENLFNIMRFHLSCLKNRCKDKSVKYVIWGASNSGQVTNSIIEKVMPQFELVGYIDKFKEGIFENHNVYKPEVISDLDFDYIIISTSTGKSEVEDTLKNKGYLILDNYIYGYGVI